MSLAALPGGGGGVSTQPWKGTYNERGRLPTRAPRDSNDDVDEPAPSLTEVRAALIVRLCVCISGELDGLRLPRKTGADRTDMASQLVSEDAVVDEAEAEGLLRRSRSAHSGSPSEGRRELALICSCSS
jgi:hypothetical protein